MAGIGFKLRQLTRQGFEVQGYLGAAVVSCGPWLFTVVSLLLSQWIAGQDRDLDLYRALITYAFAFSLLFTSLFQNVVTRYLADRLHQNDASRHWPALAGVSAFVVPGCWLLGLALFGGCPIALSQKIQAVSLLVLTSQNWIYTIFVGAVRAYRWIVLAFALGSAATILAAHQVNLLTAFVLGQFVVGALLVSSLVREFPIGPRQWDFEWVHYIRRYAGLGTAGTCMQLAVWAGVFTYWVSPEASSVAGLRFFPRHDLCLFIGMLSTVPTVTLFFLQTETSFYEAYRAFFFGILEGKIRLSDLQLHKSQMRRILLGSLTRVARVQFLVSLPLIFYSHEVLGWLGLPQEWSLNLQLAVGGSLMLAFFQCAVILLYYYELYTQAALVCLVFLCIQTLFAYLSLGWGPESYGIGLLLGSLIGFAWSAQLLRNHIQSLEFYTFTGQPMPGTLDKVPPGEEFCRQVRKDGRWLVDWQSL